MLLRVSPAELQRGPEAPVAVLAFDGVKWEAAEGNPLMRYLRTLRQLVSRAPHFFFSLGTQVDAKSGRAETFAYISSLIGLVGFFSTQLWFYTQVPSEAAKLMTLVAETSHLQLRPDAVTRLFTYGLYASPLLAYLPMHVLAGLYHLSLMLLSREKRSYDLTFRIAAYGLGPMILLALPPIGPLLAPGWILALHWVGLSAGHRLPLGITMLAMLMPLATVFIFFMRFIAQLVVLIMTVPA